MAGAGIGAFIDGLVSGVQTRRTWAEQDRRRALDDEDRKLRLEDRDFVRTERQRRNAIEDQDRALSLEDRKRKLDWAMEDRSIAEQERNRDNSREDKADANADYAIGRTRKADAKADTLAADLAAAGSAAVDSYEQANQQPESGRGVMPAEAASPAPAEATAAGTRALGAAAASQPTASPAGGDVASSPAAESIAATLPSKGVVSTPGPKEVAAATRDRASGDLMDHYRKVAIPKIVAAYLKAGDPTKAEAFQAWADTKGAEKGTKSWARAVHAAHIGDEDGFLDNLIDAANTKGYLDDGNKVDRSRSGFKKDRDGNIIGGQITYVNEASGKEFTQTFNNESDLYRMGIDYMSPEAVFDLQAKAYEAENSAKVEQAKAGAERQKQADLKAMDLENGMARDANKVQLDAAAAESKPNPAAEKDVLARVAEARGYLETSLEGFNSMSPQDQDKAILEYLARQSAVAAQVSGGSRAPRGLPPVYRGEPTGVGSQ